MIGTMGSLPALRPGWGWYLWRNGEKLPCGSCGAVLDYYTGEELPHGAGAGVHPLLVEARREGGSYGGPEGVPLPPALAVLVGLVVEVLEDPRELARAVVGGWRGRRTP